MGQKNTFTNWQDLQDYRQSVAARRQSTKNIQKNRLQENILSRDFSAEYRWLLDQE